MIIQCRSASARMQIQYLFIHMMTAQAKGIVITCPSPCAAFVSSFVSVSALRVSVSLYLQQRHQHNNAPISVSSGSELLPFQRTVSLNKRLNSVND